MYLLDFTFNSYALLSLFALVVNTTLIYLIASQGLQVSANRWFIFVLITLVVWSATESLSRFSGNPVAADFWGSIGSLGWIFVAPLFFGFTLSYIGKEGLISTVSKQIMLFGPAVLFLFLDWTTGLISIHDPALFEKVYYGWSSPTAPFFWAVLLWLDSLLVASVIVLVWYYRKQDYKNVRRQTLIFIVAVLIPILGGSITNGLLPILKIEVFPAAVILTSVMSLLITYAMLKYRLFSINPATVVSNIVQTINEILIVTNPAHRIEFVNDAVESVLGYKKEKLVGQPFQNLVKGDWEEFKNRVMDQVYSGESVSGVELSLVSADGQNVPVSFSANPLKDSKGSIYGAVGVATDISKIKQLFADITAERNKLTTTMESIVDGVLALDFDTKVIMINSAALKMLGLKGEQVLEKKLDDVISMSEGNERLRAADLLPKAVLKEDTILVQKNDLSISTLLGREVFVNLTSSAIKEGNEVGLGAIITLNDVSKEKELEEMKIDFVSMAAHELRTPLTAIRGYLSVLQEETQKSMTKEQKSFLDKAFISSSQLASLVENLLSVSKIEKGAMKLELEETDWKEVLEENFNNFIPLAKEKNIKFTLNNLDDLPKVFVDKFRVGEVISNLIANAINYTKTGGSVTVSAEANEKEVTTHVKDTGQGIPERAIPKLFTKFFRVSGVLEQGSKGTGLGLYISKAIVDMHKGRIWVESKIGIGSTFSFTVPLANIENRSALQSVTNDSTTIGVGGSKKSRRYFKT